MRTNPINPKPFRIVAEELVYSHIGTSFIHCKKPVKYAMEYKNPRAEEFYNKAKKSSNMFEKAELLEKMGDYELKALNFKEYISNVFDKLLEKCLLK